MTGRSCRAVFLMTAPTFFCIQLAFAQAAGPEAGEPLPAQVKAIHALLSRHFRPNEPGAAVIVTMNGKPVFRNAYGMADMERGTPLRPEFALRVGSITKQFTAAAIMLLVQDGKLALTDDVASYLPAFSPQGRRVTIAHLLTHTSGIRNYTALPAFGTVIAKETGVDEGMAFFRAAAPEFQPGARFSYSNSNYFLLGAVIEKVSGMTYADFMQQRIFTPLQMHSTEIETQESVPSPVAGYTHGRKGIARAPVYSMSWPYAAGALRTSVDDLARWDRAISDGILLSRSAWDKTGADSILNDGARTGYGYGWFRRKLAGSAALRHGGDIGGFSADLWRFPAEGLFVAVLANDDSHDPGADGIAEKIAKIMLRD
jgi:D-alanyl-D-alanine carboxypeptidase